MEHEEKAAKTMLKKNIEKKSENAYENINWTVGIVCHYS